MFVPYWSSRGPGSPLGILTCVWSRAGGPGWALGSLWECLCHWPAHFTYLTTYLFCEKSTPILILNRLNMIFFQKEFLFEGRIRRDVKQSTVRAVHWRQMEDLLFKPPRLIYVSLIWYCLLKKSLPCWCSGLIVTEPQTQNGGWLKRITTRPAGPSHRQHTQLLYILFFWAFQVVCWTLSTRKCSNLSSPCFQTFHICIGKWLTLFTAAAQAWPPLVEVNCDVLQADSLKQEAFLTGQTAGANQTPFRFFYTF